MDFNEALEETNALLKAQIYNYYRNTLFPTIEGCLLDSEMVSYVGVKATQFVREWWDENCKRFPALSFLRNRGLRAYDFKMEANIAARMDPKEYEIPLDSRTGLPMDPRSVVVLSVAHSTFERIVEIMKKPYEVN